MGFPKRRITKVLWAVDPFHEKPREQLRAFEALTKLFKQAPLEVLPVALLAPNQKFDGSKRTQQGWNDLAEEAKLRLEYFIGNIKYPGIRSLHFIRQEGVSKGDAASQFLRFAFAEGAQLLVVSSHGRSGLGRFLMGSFAESLVLQSPLPVLIVNPLSKAKSAPKIKQILFPTDFSDLSLKAFYRVVLLARRLGTSIVLFHKIEYLTLNSGPLFYYPTLDVDNLTALRAGIKNEAKKWIAHAEREGVRIKFHLDVGKGRPLEEILRATKKLGNATIIAMASQSGSLGVLLGSLTRQVLRHASCPVMVIHPDQDAVIEYYVQQLKQLNHEYTISPPLI